MAAVSAVQSSSGGSLDAFVLKLSADGSRLIYATYLGGSGQDQLSGLAVRGDRMQRQFPRVPGIPRKDEERAIRGVPSRCTLVLRQGVAGGRGWRPGWRARDPGAVLR